MNKKAKEKLEELKEIVLDLHRSAGMLDRLIMNIESITGEDDKFNEVLINQQCRLRFDQLKATEFGNLTEKERTIWLNLIDSFSKD